MKSRQRNLIDKIKSYIELGKVNNEFRACEFDFLKPNSVNFIWKHSDQNTKLNGNIYFIKTVRGKYKLK